MSATVEARAAVTRNAAAAAPGADAALSVAIPFYKASPAALIAELAARAGPGVEIVAADDASPDGAPAAAVAGLMAGLSVPCTLLRARRNLGRSAIRNLLADAARGRHVLFLDGDMAPGAPGFLDRWAEVAQSGAADVVFGGFEMVAAGAVDRDFALHAYQSRRSDCLDAAARAADPAKYTFTSNLLVRRSLLRSVRFDEEFRGWGWEDVDWAMRVAAVAPIVHIDNPAVHHGFSSAETLACKYRESTPNFARLHARHPSAVASFPLYRAGRVMARLPLAGRLERLFEVAMIDRRGWLPVGIRCIAAKLYRASLYRRVAAAPAAENAR